MGFDGRFPGPLIEAEVGDTIRARLTNSLSQPTTIHWHGLRIPASMDGTESVQTRGRARRVLRLRIHGSRRGNLLVPHARQRDRAARARAVRAAGRSWPRRADARRRPRADARRPEARRGRTALAVRRRPRAARGTRGRRSARERVAGAGARRSPRGQIERWRVVNAANTRFMRLSLGGRPFSILGSDGGSDRGARRGDRDPRHAGRAGRARGRAVCRGRAARARDAALRPRARRAEARAVRDCPGRAGGGVFSARARRAARDRAAGGQRDRADAHREHESADARRPRPARRRRPGRRAPGLGARQRDEPGPPVPPARLLLPGALRRRRSPGRTPSTSRRRHSVRIAWLPDDRPGEWMYHCHILEHHAMGMMAHFRVVA